jgi:phosphate transport system substrate-binding protein
MTALPPRSRNGNKAEIAYHASPTNPLEKSRMQRRVFMAGLAAALFAAPALSADITGAGATFPYPIYAKWADAYRKSTGVGLNYQSIGSGGGIKQITAKTVDFGASDAPLKPEDLEKNGLIQFPAIMGGVVPVYNIKGVEAGKIRLSPALLADIYLGKI